MLPCLGLFFSFPCCFSLFSVADFPYLSLLFFSHMLVIILPVLVLNGLLFFLVNLGLSWCLSGSSLRCLAVLSLNSPQRGIRKSYISSLIMSSVMNKSYDDKWFILIILYLISIYFHTCFYLLLKDIHIFNMLYDIFFGIFYYINTLKENTRIFIMYLELLWHWFSLIFLSILPTRITTKCSLLS